MEGYETIPLTLEFDDFTTIEMQMLGDLMQAGGFTKMEDMIRVALWQYARHVGVQAPPEILELRIRLERLGRMRKRQ